MDRKKASLLWMLLASVVLLGRILPWSLSDLSHDEIHTVCNFSGLLTGRGFWEIFRVYPYANNHFLCSALYWLWLKVIPGRTAPELLLRLPSLFQAILTLAAIIWGWRRYLGSRLAGLTASRAKLLATYTAGHEATPQFVMSIDHYQVYSLSRQ